MRMETVKSVKPKRIIDLVEASHDIVFSCDLDERLVLAVKAQKKKDGIKWRHILENSFIRYLEESGVPDPRLMERKRK